MWGGVKGCLRMWCGVVWCLLMGHCAVWCGCWASLTCMESRKALTMAALTGTKALEGDVGERAERTRETKEK